MSQEKLASIHFQVEQSLKKKVNTYCKKNGVTKSQVARWAIIYYMENFDKIVESMKKS